MKNRNVFNLTSWLSKILTSTSFIALVKPLIRKLRKKLRQIENLEKLKRPLTLEEKAKVSSNPFRLFVLSVFLSFL